ncbi:MULTISPECIES: helix-turn-helix domain-containing protein [Anaerotruncus]|jgi:transcriptional regulator with XRE-family HTH domain|uniref:XRE family transcriptional regulator n=2 Tax=Anaerotruncus TaxID=244127 RepID=A0A498CMI0_9FIRM|nr:MULTISPECIES: helix-turn-helix transcriptional regulator [Anaerotruncus]MBC3938506.1 helix-turn-helix transcriptional regulator [Anaerotruncus massiliensis (ex Togo et al. 2019)]RLL12117.1 XRE family transcriptional regulator [Anaerotruncus massiliensis (ex Liu et al. 2021)]
MTVKDLGQKIKARRLLSGLNQEVFAENVGISLRLLSKLECGFGNPTFVTIDCIAAAFGLQIEDLVQPDETIELIPKCDLTRLQPMLDRLPPPLQCLFMDCTEGALVRLLESSRNSDSDHTEEISQV